MHKDEEYRQVFVELQEDLSNLSVINVGRRCRDPVMIVVLVSPGRLAPYHVALRSRYLALLPKRVSHDKLAGASSLHLLRLIDDLNGDSPEIGSN